MATQHTITYWVVLEPDSDEQGPAFERRRDAVAYRGRLLDEGYIEVGPATKRTVEFEGGLFAAFQAGRYYGEYDWKW